MSRCFGPEGFKRRLAKQMSRPKRVALDTPADSCPDCQERLTSDTGEDRSASCGFVASLRGQSALSRGRKRTGAVIVEFACPFDWATAVA